MPPGNPPPQTTAQALSSSTYSSLTLSSADYSSPSTGMATYVATTASISLPCVVTSIGTGTTLRPPPTRAGRQRGSNITVENPEYEFQKTALNACRSTIAQQETELRSLREALDIRNKRILQLESQIGHASQFIAGREPPTSNDIPENQLQTILVRIKSIEDKLLGFSPPHASPNIVINACKTSCTTPVQIQTSSTQTFQDCEPTVVGSGHPTDHTETHHSDQEVCPDL